MNNSKTQSTQNKSTSSQNSSRNSWLKNFWSTRKVLVLVVAGLAILTGFVTFYPRFAEFKTSLKPDYGTAEFYPEVAVPMDLQGEMAEPGFDRSWAEPTIGISPIMPGVDHALDVRDRVYEHFASFGIVVANVSEYAQSLRERTLGLDGQVLSVNLSTVDQCRVVFVTLKVPNDHFDELNNYITGGAKEVVRESVSVWDRTGELVSLTERREFLEEEKLSKEIALLEARSEVERRRLELEISRLERQLRQLDDQAQRLDEDINYATVHVQAADDARYFDPQSRPSLDEELRRAWQSLGDVFYLVGQFLIWVGVYAVLWLPLVLVVRWGWRRWVR